MRKIRMAYRALLTAIAASPSMAIAATIISFSPGPGDTTRVNTPWGVYIAESVAGGIWVGTEEEWTNTVADRVSSQNGFKRIRIDGQPANSRDYVSRAFPQLLIGGKFMYSIQSYIYFNGPASKSLGRPIRPKGYEYFGLVWRPQDYTQKTTARILIGSRQFAPNICSYDQGFRSCEFSIPKTSMNQPAAAYFLLAGNKPVALPMKSIAWHVYRDIRAKYATQDMFPVGSEDTADLSSLHAINPDIPVTFKFGDPLP